MFVLIIANKYVLAHGTALTDLGCLDLLEVDEVGTVVVAHLEVHRRRVDVDVAVLLRLELEILGSGRTRDGTLSETVSSISN